MIYPGHIISTFRQWAKRDREESGEVDAITVDNHQANGAHGVHQARVTMAGDPATYRLIVAPADAPITIAGRPAEEYFSKPLGDR